MTTRRRDLEQVRQQPRSTHTGLWFDRFYTADPNSKDNGRREHIQAVVALGVPDVYRDFYALWQSSLPTSCVRAIAEVRGRMVLGTGAKGVVEAGITLHRTYGVPYIPGSALKGLVAAFANTRLVGFDKRTEPHIPASKPGEQLEPPKPYHTLFGAENSAGYVTFFDALYIPGSAKDNKPLTPDVITGHHGAYYVGDQPKPPADWDSPNPVSFLTATGQYLIALDGPVAWVATAHKLLGLALDELGIGAKTAAGYGRMRLLPYTDEMPDTVGEAAEPQPEPQPALSAFEEFTAKLGGVGETNATVQGRAGLRARYNAQSLGRKPAFNDHARIRLYADGSAEIMDLLS